MKKLLITTTCITTLLLSTSIFAESITKMIEVTSAPNTIFVNNSKISTDSFLYNGTTYVPLRAITEAMGAKVDFDSANKKISINSPVATSSSNMDNFTPKQLRAISLIKEWTSFFNLSRSEVQKSLKNMTDFDEYYLNFTDEEVNFALDNCGVNWQEQATKQAKFYKEGDLTKLEILTRLKEEGFTQAQIDTAIKSIGL